MVIAFYVDVPEDDLKRYLRAAHAACGLSLADDIAIEQEVKRLVEHSKRTTSYEPGRYVGILLDRAISYLKIKEQFGD